jgi:hypothetical protein
MAKEPLTVTEEGDRVIEAIYREREEGTRPLDHAR